jgi:cysteinyl-tRNA synthetase
MKIYNTLTKKKEEFTPLCPGNVGMYHCGPTVYDHVHIGNLRSFLLGDFTRRSFEYLGYKVNQVMNITDVGHLISDGDDGDDKMTKALKRENLDITIENMIKIATTYTESFKQDLLSLNIKPPHHMPKASDHIQEDISIIQKLDEGGYIYVTSDGVYFDTSKMKDYGKLGGLNIDDAESRIETNSEKRQAADFALWKFDDNNGWDSPWGHGFPGWHIECSGMSMKYLGEQFDIHTGGADLKSVHHNNEIAQSECATGTTPFVNYWMHGEMLNFGGAKLSKSSGGNITLKTLQEKGFSPLDYRYLSLQTHYRSPMNFTWDTLQSAKNGFQKIKDHVIDLKESCQPGTVDTSFEQEFTKAISDDLNIPQALAIFHTMLKSDLDNTHKLATAYRFDEVLGLDLNNLHTEIFDVPKKVQGLLSERKKARLNKNWDLADELRNQIQSQGFDVLDTDSGQKLSKKTHS